MPSDDVLAAIHRNMLRASLRTGSLTPQAQAEQVGPWLLIDAGVDVPGFNKAILADPPQHPASAIETATEWFEARNATFSFLLREGDDPELARELSARGYQLTEEMPAMLIEDLPSSFSPPPSLEVLVPTTREEIAEYAQVDAPEWQVIIEGIARTVSGFPDFVMLLGRVAGKKAVTSMAVITEDLAGVYNVNVEPALRRQGLGRAITEAAMFEGVRRGCTRASLQSTPEGVPLYREMGFKTVYHYLDFTPSEAVSSAAAAVQ